MKKAPETAFFFSNQLKFKDHFKDNDHLSATGLNRLSLNYSNVTDEAVNLVHKLIDKLTRFSDLMKLNRTDLIDNEINHQSADEIFIETEQVLHELEEAIEKGSKDTIRFQVYSSALNYSDNFIKHQVQELEANEPSSLALKWYNEHQSKTIDSEAGSVLK